ncbi:unnamed protein product [Allacma fusca]|uniref:Uncharacterized protein n=1 Tax=Allacma fusca TaxID=39272 RepID=A0A8J2NYN5_9HEXA|nr:unnamed protein product [Allacma fusca]
MKLKLGVIGPTGSGKTTLCNLLGNDGFGDTANTHLPYRPTHSIRITEFPVQNIEGLNYRLEVDCQLWEIGGSPKLKPLWTAVQNNMDGAIVLYDVNNDSHVRDAGAFFMHFVTHAPIGNVFRGQKETGVQKIVGIGQRVRHIAVNLDDDAAYLREEFRHFVGGVAQVLLEREKVVMFT